MSGLDDFFEQMRPFLLGQRNSEEIEDALGTSPSGRANLEFYRTLIRRNFNKFLADMYPTVFRVAKQIDEDLWTTLVDEYSRGRHPKAHDPNEFSEGFSDFLATRRATHPDQPEIMEQLADLHWLRHEVNIAPDGEDDGFERRLFIRQYSYPLPQFYKTISKDADAPLPEARDTLAVIYRSTRTLAPNALVITGPQLAVLARRQGHQLPGPLAEIPDAAIDAAEKTLVERGVLVSLQ